MYKLMSKLLTLVISFILTGCAVMTSNDVRITGRPVTAEQLKQLKVTKTTYKETVALLGLPSDSVGESPAAGVEGALERIISYKSEKNISESTGILLLLFDNKNKIEKNETTLVFEKGILTKVYTK